MDGWMDKNSFEKNERDANFYIPGYNAPIIVPLMGHTKTKNYKKLSLTKKIRVLKKLEPK